MSPSVPDNNGIEIKTMDSETKPTYKIWRKKNPIYLCLLLLCVLLVRSIWVVAGEKSQNWWLLLGSLMIPVAFAATIVAGLGNPAPHQRLIAGAAVAAIVGNQFPRVVSIGLASLGITLFSLTTRPSITHKPQHAGSSTRGKLKAAFAAVFLALVLLVDNFFVWVVAATYFPSHQGSPQPLQDNGRLAQVAFLEGYLGLSRRSVQFLRSVLNVQWALVASAGAALASVELQWVPNRTLWGVTIHALLCLAALRAIRVFSFLLTVLPSQMPSCYRQHFPQPPADWTSWAMVGLIPNSHGGCNDLIISGHATVTSILACLAASVAGNPLFSFSLWSLLTIDFLIEVYEGFHYSVDMWLGALIALLLWRIMSPLEKIDSEAEPAKLLPLSSVSKSTIIEYSLPAIGAFVVVAAVPERVANYCIILSLVLAGVMVGRRGFTHYLQHMLFCVLFLALCIYL